MSKPKTYGIFEPVLPLMLTISTKKQLTSKKIKEIIIDTGFFIDNRGINKYSKLIARNLNTKQTGYTEMHHFIPKSVYPIRILVNLNYKHVPTIPNKKGIKYKGNANQYKTDRNLYLKDKRKYGNMLKPNSKAVKMVHSGMNSNLNLVNLSYKDHILAHFYLYMNFRRDDNQYSTAPKNSVYNGNFNSIKTFKAMFQEKTLYRLTEKELLNYVKERIDQVSKFREEYHNWLRNKSLPKPQKVARKYKLEKIAKTVYTKPKI